MHLFVEDGGNLLLGDVFVFFCFSKLKYFRERFAESSYVQ